MCDTLKALSVHCEHMRKSSHHVSIFLTNLGIAIKNRRLELDLTQEELAEKTELHRTYITDVEAGHRNISLLTYESLTHGLLCALSLPMVVAERKMNGKPSSELYGENDGLSEASRLLHLNSRFCQDLDIIALELHVKTEMSRLQSAVESFGFKHNAYPGRGEELVEALAGQILLNPFTNKREQPSIGVSISEEFATTRICFLSPGHIEYSPMKNGINYVIRSGGANGKGLAGSSPGKNYVLSANLRTDNQP